MLLSRSCAISTTCGRRTIVTTSTFHPTRISSPKNIFEEYVTKKFTSQNILQSDLLHAPDHLQNTRSYPSYTGCPYWRTWIWASYLVRRSLTPSGVWTCCLHGLRLIAFSRRTMYHLILNKEETWRLTKNLAWRMKHSSRVYPANLEARRRVGR